MKAPLVSHRSLLASLLVTLAASAAACSTTSPSTPDGSGGNTSTTGKGGTTGGGLGGTTGGGLGGTAGPSMGTGGSTTTTVVQKLCAAKTTVVNPVLLNFENYDGTVTADKYATAFGGATVGTGTAYTGPYLFGDGSVTPTLALLAGHPPSQWAVSETAMQARTWGMGGGFWMSCANASAFKGISFFVRGSSPTNVFSFSVATENTSMPDANNAAGGGTCPGTAATCTPPTKLNIPLTADWTQVQIMWADFAPGMSGATAVIPNGDNITGFLWSVPLMFALDPSAAADANGPYTALAGDLVIKIDDVSFIP
jgi:hypothetical protein